MKYYAYINNEIYHCILKDNFVSIVSIECKVHLMILFGWYNRFGKYDICIAGVP